MPGVLLGWGGAAGGRTRETFCKTGSCCVPGPWVPSSLHPAAWISRAQLCPPSCWLPVWHSCLLSRQPPTQVLMPVSCSPDGQRGYLPELCRHLRQQTSSNQQDCRCAVSGQLRPAHAVCQLLVALLWGLGTRPAPVPFCCRREEAACGSIRTLEVS